MSAQLPFSARKHLNRDKRLQVKTLREINHMTYREIAAALQITERQVRTAVKAPLDPPKRPNRPIKLTDKQIEELISFISSSREARRMPWNELPWALGWGGSVCEYAITRALSTAGYSRYSARKKPPITELTRLKRLAFAEKYGYWTADQWASILWSDETSVAAGRFKKLWVTRLLDEEFDLTCIIDKESSPGWIFWGCFAGTEKGPGILWEKDWGTINQYTYAEKIVPIIEAWVTMQRNYEGRELVFMQDNAPAHSAESVQFELESRGIRLLDWPPYSPDLNPIEHIWDWMKEYIANK